MKEITISCNWLTKAGRRHLAQILAPFSWRIAGPRKVQVLQGSDVWPTPAAGASAWPEIVQQTVVRGAPEGILVPRERPKDLLRPQSPPTRPQRQTPQRRLCRPCSKSHRLRQRARCRQGRVQTAIRGALRRQRAPWKTARPEGRKRLTKRSKKKGG